MKKAQHLKASKPRLAALKLQAALAIEILLNAPMRIGNLSALHLERHLRRIGRGRARQIHIHVPATEVKNDKDLDYLLPPHVAELLNLYLEQARPVLEGTRSAFLFPAMDGGAKSPNGLSNLIKDTILEHTGLTINAQLARRQISSAIAFHPNYAKLYSKAVAKIASLLAHEDTRADAMEAIRSLVDRIEVCAGAKRGETEVTLVGRLAGILALGTNKNTRSDEATGGTFLLVAGVGFEPTTFRL